MEGNAITGLLQAIAAGEITLTGIAMEITMVILAIFSGYGANQTRKCKKAVERSAERAALRAEENLLAMMMTSANTELSIATAMAYQDGKPDGRMERALAAAEETQKEYQQFIKEMAAKKMMMHRD